MTRCFHPLEAVQEGDGRLKFGSGVQDRIQGRPLWIRCGRCIGCRLDRSQQWAVRCMHECRMHASNSFITLTYDDAKSKDLGYVPMSLEYRHFQLFMKRLRKSNSNVRFYMCGEYGPRNFRPHFHACLFGIFFEDREVYRDLSSGSRIYTSAKLEELWPYGFASVGDVTFESAAYVARYVCQKIVGRDADEHYRRFDVESGEVFQLEPEFNRMSLKPGIGARWFDKYQRQLVVHDAAIVDGRKVRMPKYYQAKFDDQTLAELEYRRYMAITPEMVRDSSDERLEVLEAVCKASLRRSTARTLE